MNIPRYPDDFFNFGKGVDISDDEINKWIEKLVQELEENPKYYALSKSCGNTYVKVDRDEISKYRILVTKNYQEKEIY